MSHLPVGVRQGRRAGAGAAGVRPLLPRRLPHRLVAPAARHVPDLPRWSAAAAAAPANESGVSAHAAASDRRRHGPR